MRSPSIFRRSISSIATLLICGLLIASQASYLQAHDAIETVSVHLGEPIATSVRPLTPSGIGTESVRTIYGFEDLLGAAAINQLAPQLMRYPGGNSGNFYNWRTDTFIEPTTPGREDYNPSLYPRGNYKVTGVYSRDYVAGRTYALGFDDFLAVARNANAEPILVVNLYWPLEASIDELAQEAADWVYHVNIERGLNIKYWELGNEYYLEEWQRPENRYAPRDGKTASEIYAEVITVVAARMRAVDSSIQLLAVGIQPGDLARPGRPDEGAAAAWSVGLKQARDAYDGIVIHPYVPVPDISYEARANWLFSVADALPGGVQRYFQQEYGPDVKVWYTEGGAAANNNNDGDNENEADLKFSHMNALFDADFTLNHLDYAETIAGLLRFQITKDLYGVYRYCTNPNDINDYSLYRTPSFYAFSSLNQVLQDTRASIPVNVEHMPTFLGSYQYADRVIPGLTLRAFEQADGTTAIAVVNKLSEPQQVTLSGTGVVPGGGGSFTTLTGPLAARNSCDAPDTVVPTTTLFALAPDQSLTLPGYSFSVVTLYPGASAPLRPVLECVVEHGPDSFTAYFGYKNENTHPVYVASGANNKFTPGPEDRGQTTHFAPGRTPYYPNAAFSVAFDGNNLVWTLNGRTSTASRNSTRCAA